MLHWLHNTSPPDRTVISDHEMSELGGPSTLDSGWPKGCLALP